MPMMFGNRQRQLPMTQRIIYIPLVAMAIGFLMMGYLSIQTTRGSLMKQMTEHAVSLSEQMASRIDDHQQAMKTIDGLLEDKIELVGLAASDQYERFSGLTLRAISKRYGVGETNWFDATGTIIASTIHRYEGWVAPADHPVRVFMGMDAKVWSEPIRKDSESNRFNKYGYYRLNDGKFLQIALPADGVQRLTDQFTEAHLVSRLSDQKGIVNVAYFDKNFTLVASSKSQKQIFNPNLRAFNPADSLDDTAKQRLRLGQKVSLQDPSSEFFEVYVPLLEKGLIKGTISIAYNLDAVRTAIWDSAIRIAVLGILTLVILVLLMEYLLKRYVATPIVELTDDMGKIHVETDRTYRLPEMSSDPFRELRQTTNQVLNITHQYFEEIIAHQEELIASNEELEAVVGQLSASEEELRAQYDEIEAYAHHMALLKKRYSIAIEATACYIWEYHFSNGSLVISDHLVERIGASSDVMPLEHFVSRFVHHDDMHLVLSSLGTMTMPLLAEAENLHLQMRLKEKDGSWHWYQMQGGMSGEEPLGGPQLAGVIVDIHRQKEQELYIQYIAEHDMLTGLFSRRKFQEHVSKAIDSGKSGAVMLMDIDNFKYINDFYGHVYGDKVLKHFAGLLKVHMCESSQVYRLGGDEFIIHVDGEEPVLRALECLDAFIEQLQEHQIIDGLEQRITVSTGVARYPEHANKVDDLLMKADMAMYHVKKSGKNHSSCYNEGLQEALRHRLKVENHLRHAIATDGFVLHYQPVMLAGTDQVAYFEALIRLKDNAYSPTDLIAVAEESGLINAIGGWVIEETIRQQVAWRSSGLCIRPIAINISPRQMMDVQLVGHISSLLERYQLPAEFIEVEITENILVENRVENLSTLHAFRDLGLKIALDDFGTGFSSLNYLTFIPVDKIKLDKSLKDKFIDHESNQVMDSLISLAHGLNLKVVAEGVETAHENARLISGRCDYLQGYFYSRPVDVAIAAQYLLAQGKDREVSSESSTVV